MSWTRPSPATKSDKDAFRNYVARLANAYVYEKEGGKTEEPLWVDTGYTGDSGRYFRVDNEPKRGRLIENKVSVCSDGNQGIQLRWYLRYLKKNGGSLDYNFFRNPTGRPVGPNYKFASILADAATKYDVGVHIIDHDWWEELQ